MRLSKRQLKRIIKEEKLKLMRERAAAKRSSTLKMTINQLRAVIAEAILLEGDEGGEDEGGEDESAPEASDGFDRDDKGYTEEEMAQHRAEREAKGPQDMR